MMVMEAAPAEGKHADGDAKLADYRRLLREGAALIQQGRLDDDEAREWNDQASELVVETAGALEWARAEANREAQPDWDSWAVDRTVNCAR